MNKNIRAIFFIMQHYEKILLVCNILLAIFGDYFFCSSILTRTWTSSSNFLLIARRSAITPKIAVCTPQKIKITEKINDCK